jgi:outer membrane protein assembly factor BamB
MSTATAPRASHRLWLPLLVLIAASLAGAAVLYWPSEGDRANRNVTLLAVALASVLVLALWMLFLSRFPLAVRLATVGLVVGGGALFLAVGVREVHFSGDMVPVFTFRWESSHDDILEQHRHRPGAVSAGPVALAAPSADDFPGYLGPRRNGDAGGPALATDWKAHPPGELWRQPVGGGYAGFAVARGVAVTIEQRRDQEAVVCYDAAGGRECWSYAWPALFSERLGGDGPRATPTIFDDGVFALGATGKLVCLDLATGQLRWEADVLKDNGNLPWGMAGSPLVDQTLVIVTPGAQTAGAKGRAVIAYDRETGREVWAGGDHRGAYSSPMFADLGGQRHVLSFDGDGLTGYDARDGRPLWHFPWVTQPQWINVAQPLVFDGDRVFITSGYDVGCAMLRIKKSGDSFEPPEVLWQNRRMRCKFSSPVHRDGFLYGLDDGVLVCLDARTGEQRWKGSRYGHGQMLLTNGLLLVLSETGKLALVEATPERFHELARLDALPGPKTWNPPALAGGKAYLRNHLEMVCYDLTPAGR